MSYEIKKTHLEIIFGLNFPYGDVTSTEYWVLKHDGFANTGYLFGIEYCGSVLEELELGLAGYFSVNSFNENDYIKTVWWGQNPEFSAFETSSWYFVDIYSSIGFRTELSPANIYVKGYCGLSAIKLPKIDWKYSGGLPTYFLPEKMSYAVGYGLGTGITINDKVDVGLRYFYSWHVYHRETRGYDISKNSYKDEEVYKLSSPRILLFVGYIF